MGSSEHPPVAVFYAGPNGAGKRTLRRMGLDEGLPEAIRHINSDEIAVELNSRNPRAVDLAAGRIALESARECIESRHSFSMETTLAGHGALRRIQQAVDAQFFVKINFVGVDSAERAIARVAVGGHSVAPEIVRRRYADSLINPLTPCPGHANPTSRRLRNAGFQDGRAISPHPGLSSRTPPSWTSLGGMMRKFDGNFKRKVVREYIAGQGGNKFLI